ncbi:hypothetical protein BT93_G1656 [Corymbia citriodora subsp. variegata]|nr:hypothetical protein BT93_G1656 [Corymbia citriodora subsp. variegata]
MQKRFIPGSTVIKVKRVVLLVSKDNLSFSLSKQGGSHKCVVEVEFYFVVSSQNASVVTFNVMWWCGVYVASIYMYDLSCYLSKAQLQISLKAKLCASLC